MFVQNESMLDRLLRVAIGVVVLSLVFIGPRTSWGWLGLIPLVTGIIGSCPLYRLLGLSTHRDSGREEHASCCDERVA